MEQEQNLQEQLANMEKQLARNDRRLNRERLARKDAEQLLESKSLQLYQSNQSLKELTENLERQIQERTKELENEKDHALYLSQIKSEFVATMSHEIRTPLNGIMSVLELLQEHHLNREQNQLLNIARHSSKTLLCVINDILDFSKIEAGQMQFEQIAFNLQQLLKNIHMSFLQKAQKKGIALNLYIDSTVPEYIESDPIRLTQVLNNYLSNAIKFTEYGGVSINVISQSELINFSVCDSGVGIPEEKLDLLFKDFSQVDASTTRKYGGTGLGLVITKRIVENMNGSVSVNSKLSEGSCFSAVLPLKKATAQQATDLNNVSILENQLKPVEDLDLSGHDHSQKANLEPVHSTENQKHSPTSHILLVDDNAVNRLVGEKTLHALGFEVTLAPSGFDAIDKLSTTNNYDMILMDCQMPELSGYDTTKILRNQKIKLPIIALTANTSKEDREMAQESGMNGFITKPFSIAEIRDTLMKFLDKK
ncbi:response regulator [Thiomicrorhabdus sp. 6S2-11]|uniref:histidine kinase n=1 Tax=Thiomicrorhabdus marina TaxID=2818442 RepID=A0ABS3Q687_9GAMM|nr:ATP-binding protein [Thiomicrorhabdus marina]MBO1927866.1 response regulator [Thiomicrorhabdus marina]